MSDLENDPHPENEEYNVFPSNGSTLFFEDPSTKATSMCSLSNMLFLGTNRGTVTQYILEECEMNETTFSYVELLARTISDSDVVRMDACTELRLLTLLSSNILFVCDAEQLEMVNFFPTCRGVSTFQLQPDGAQSAKLCLAFLTRFIQIYRITPTNASLIFEHKLTVLPSSLCVGENFLCFATEGRYTSLNLHTKATTDLFSYDQQQNSKPFLASVANDEFLISGPGSLGVIVDANGTSHRPPLQLSPNVLSVFIWKEYVFSLTDEFFTIHSIFNQKQLQTVLLPNAVAGCFSSRNPHLVFVAYVSKTSGLVDILSIGPERWDRFARKLILAGCLQQAKQLLQREQQRVEDIFQAQPASSKNEQNVFATRSRRVYGLVGFYHFEQGDFQHAGLFFERSLLDIRELLCRYDNLLPNGFAFAPHWFYNLSCQKPTDNDSNNIRRVAELCLSHSIDTKGQPNMAANATWTVRYEEFLFSFLQKHHKSKFTEKYMHLLETALVKLYLKLLRRGRNPQLTELLLSNNRLIPLGLGWDSENSEAEQRGLDLVSLISSLVHIDVDDLTAYLEQSSEHHALSLIYQWQGNVAGALSIWQKLAYGELVDVNFPGVDFYVAVLSWLASPNAEPIKLWSVAENEQQDTASPPHISEPPVYTELIWQHLCQSLEPERPKEIAEKLLFALPYLPGDDYNSQWDYILLDESCSQTTTDVSLAPSQCLTPTHILRRLIPQYVDLGIKYLHHLIYVHHDMTPRYHTLLAQIYLDILTGKIRDETSAANSKARSIQLRRDFCHLLRHSNNYSVSKLLEGVRQCDVPNEFAYELAILLGKNDQHRDALELLVNQLSDLPAALCYCLSYVNEDKTCVTGGSDGRWVPQYTYTQKWKALQLTSNEHPLDHDVIERASEMFTILVELCFKRRAEAEYEEVAMNLLNSPNIPLQFSKVLSIIPADIHLSQVNGFLQRAFHSVVSMKAASQIHFGLAKSCARLSATGASSQVCPKLVVEKSTKCCRCQQELVAYGPDNPFAWLVQRKQFAHVHCL
ncbi:transforming growth factor, beta receptor associated protein 1 [Clonorchis sinensis]|uniref:Transforming growth factor, beta receptor associated protein 1 n=1 Tax=Clonorchis sinensis TaxID=79923 RepID=A0A8T1MB89_CLOSI|nr:transforming growth factor, beta receptor associated protein 1 [Clonorchis sinensis]